MTNTSKQTTRLRWWQTVIAILCFIPFAPILIALGILVLTLYACYSICLHLLIWCWWCGRGRDILIVYSNSPIWHDYVEDRLLVHSIVSRAHVLNWSERKRWRFNLAKLAFHHFGGQYEFNPMAVVFRPLRRTRIFRFWKPFKDFKHGHPEMLEAMEREFFKAIGASAFSAGL